MKNKIIQAIESEHIQGKKITNFAPGDAVVVHVKVKEGDRERIQAFEGVVIAARNRGLNSAVTVRKISHGEGVERVFPIYSPMIEKIQIQRRGHVRRSKLYYLRHLEGRKARIRERLVKGEQTNEAQPSKTEPQKTEE